MKPPKIKGGIVDYGVLEQGDKIEVPKEWIMGCCDCGLVHRMFFKLERTDKKTGLRTLTVQVFRDNRRTAAKRRKKGVMVVPVKK
jgi:hypothetical protein